MLYYSPVVMSWARQCLICELVLPLTQCSILEAGTSLVNSLWCSQTVWWVSPWHQDELQPQLAHLSHSISIPGSVKCSVNRFMVLLSFTPAASLIHFMTPEIAPIFTGWTLAQHSQSCWFISAADLLCWALGYLPRLETCVKLCVKMQFLEINLSSSRLLLTK